ncbi:MAG: chromosome segregation protein SMC [Candidatus Zixiibacteriota bacterium]
MYLKHLNILGFKSFANKTTVQFSNGITAIVGPNGCGKTNILDALRWVLGEQRVSLLRGSKMEEVIFNGTRDLKPLNMAEVTLTLVNDRGLLPTEYNEVQITRRLFRDGESEYLLNKVPCRLRDITELFFDTGVGAHSYSVIQQEMIDAVISDKAEERRLLFEEAAGITKYKQRKKAALRKLEATDSDLLRLNDIYAEVKTQANSLKRQHRKAERYQTIANDIKNWELYLGSHRVREIEAEQKQLSAERKTLLDQKVSKETTLNSISAQQERERKEQLDLERQLAAAGKEEHEISEKAHAYEKEISILTEKRANAKILIERNQNEINALWARDKILQDQAAAAEEELKLQKADADTFALRICEAERAQAEADRRLLEARRAKDRESGKLIDLEGKLSSGRTADASLREQLRELTKLVEDFDRRIVESTASKQSLADQVAAHQRELDEIVVKKEAAEKSYDEVTERLERLIEKSEEISLEMTNLTASIEACQARRHLLEDMILQYEGYEAGVVAAMEVKERFPGIVGTVADEFVPMEGMEAAVGAALGEMAGFLICDNRQTAESIIAYLKAENKGRLGILVPDSGTVNPAVKRPELVMPEFVGWLDGFVSTGESLRPLMEAVLAWTAVFKEGSDPTEILRQLPYGFKAVSTDGVVYGKNVIAGGSEHKIPLFRRKEKVAEQQRLIEQLKQKLSTVQQEKNKTTAEIATARAESSELSQYLESLSEKLQAIRQQLSEVEYQQRTVESEIERLQQERQHCQDKLEKIQARQHTLGLDFNQLSDQKTKLTDAMSQAGEELTRCEAAAAEALERLSKLQVALVEAKSKVEQSETKLTHTVELRQEISNTIASKEQEIRDAKQEIETAGRRISDLERQLRLIFEQRGSVETRQADLRARQSELLERISTKEEQLKDVRSERDHLSEQIHQLDIRLATLESESNAVFDRIHNEYDVDLRSIEIEKPDEKLSKEEAQRHVLAQKEALKKFGAVNLLALEEYRTASERERFLREQLQDLSNAKNDLQTTITKINQTARTLFTETFDQVRRNFNELFVELFSGGEADIYLEDPSEPLESNIEIIARPGRKRLLSINQMSGGERALTAIALLFSLYLVKPSPFCILDEIDAPLDDANCRRFLKIINRFADHTQFVIITHNKITMEAADNLYGVTMEQPGVSKLVAVKFADVHRDEATGTITIHSETDESDHDTVLLPQDGTDANKELPKTVVERLQPSIPSGTHDHNLDDHN